MNPKDELPHALPGQEPKGAVDVAPQRSGSPGLGGLPAYPTSAGGRTAMPYSSKTNGAAISGFILGMSGIGAIGGVVWGVRALNQIQSSGERGRGFAIAGMVFSGLWVVSAVTMLFVGIARDSEPGPRSAGSLQVGDCVGDIGESSTMSSATTVYCDQPHDAEVYYQFNLSGSWPGKDVLVRNATGACRSELYERYAGNPMLDRVNPMALYPSDERSFNSSREVTCLLVSRDDSKLTEKLSR
ncbi:DUF4190 domain-containing protein [Nocardia sp. NPDC005978]|uniref:DUF4190 domain-containing protein n=1 Tax=Nocardia sp. NPDC005978 TaxID=3156725 RepID=UPI0033B02033